MLTDSEELRVLNGGISDHDRGAGRRVDSAEDEAPGARLAAEHERAGSGDSEALDQDADVTSLPAIQPGLQAVASIVVGGAVSNRHVLKVVIRAVGLYVNSAEKNEAFWVSETDGTQIEKVSLLYADGAVPLVLLNSLCSTSRCRAPMTDRPCRRFPFETTRAMWTFVQQLTMIPSPPLSSIRSPRTAMSRHDRNAASVAEPFEPGGSCVSLPVHHN